MAVDSQEKQSLTNKVKAKLDKAQRIFLISNVLMTLLFATNSVVKMIQGFASETLKVLILALLGAYIIAFVVLVILFNKDKKNLSSNMKNYKFSIKVMKQVVNIINLALALSVMAQAFTEDTGGQKIFSLILAFFAVVMAVFKFVLLIFKFIRKKKKAAKKAQMKAEKAAAKEAKVNNIKSKLQGLGIIDTPSNEIAVGTEEETQNSEPEE